MVFFSFIQKQFCHHQHLLWSDVWKHTGTHSVNIVIPIDDRGSVVKLKMKS